MRWQIPNCLPLVWVDLASNLVAVYTKTLTHMFCIVLADRPHGSWKRSAWKGIFLKTGLRVEKYENAALPFSCGRWIRILSKTMMPSPHPSTSCLQPLNPAPPVGVEYELQRFESFQWMRVDTNILKTMSRKTEEKKIVFVLADKALVWLIILPKPTEQTLKHCFRYASLTCQVQARGLIFGWLLFD